MASFNLGNSKNKLVLVVIILASLFLFSVNEEASAKVINLGTTTDSIFVGGKLGIGTTNPGATLELKPVGNSKIIIDSSNSGSRSLQLGGSANNWNILADIAVDTSLRFIQTGSERMRITQVGNVGIGTTNPGAKLVIQGTGSSVAIGDWSSTYSGFSMVGDVTGGNYNFLSSPSDPTLYINRPLGGGIYFRENNGFNSQVSILSGGNVGIGTTTPNTKLTVSGGTGNALYMNGGQINGLNSTPVNSDQAVPLGYLQANYSPTTATNNAWTMTGNTLANDNAWLGSISNYDVSFKTNNTERMRILKGGNVGIGITNPSQKIQTIGNAILGDTRDSYVLVGNNAIGASSTSQFNPGYYVYRSGSTLYGMKLQYGNAGDYSTAIFASNQASRSITFGRLDGTTSDNQFQERMRIDVNSGNIGIGTTNPQFKSDLSLGVVSGNANTGYNVFADATGNVGYAGYNLQLNNSSGNASGYLRLARTAGTAFLGMELASQSVNGIRFLTHSTSPVEVMRINALGNVGIGTTTPTTRLTVSGGTGNALYMNGGQISGLNSTPLNADHAVPLGYLQANYNSSASELWKGTKNGNIWNGDAGLGNVGIGTTAPLSKFHVASTTSFNTLISSNGPSSINAYVGIEFRPSSYYPATGAGGISLEQREVSGNFRTRMDFSVYNGSRRYPMVIDGDNVGIGTLTPTTTLQIGDIGGSASPSQLFLGQHQGGSGNGRPMLLGNWPSPLFWGIGPNSISFDHTLRIGSVTGPGVDWGAQGAFTLRTNNFIADGNIGIGTTTLNSKLTIAGGTGNVVNIGGGQIAGLNSTPLNADQAVPLGYLQANYSPSNATTLWTGTKNGNIWNGDLGEGNVGIGTTAPTARLEVAGDVISKGLLWNYNYWEPGKSIVPTGFALSDLIYADNLFVAVSIDGMVANSSDGDNWVVTREMDYKTFSGITYGNGLFVVVTRDGEILSSPDTKNWKTVTQVEANLQKVQFGNGIFVAISGVGNIYTSVDGENWNGFMFNSLIDIEYGNGYFVAVSSDGNVYYSPDGINWTLNQTTGLPFTSVAYGDGFFALAAADGSIQLYQYDNINGLWNIQTSKNQDFNTPLDTITYGNGIFMAVGQWYIFTCSDYAFNVPNTWAQRSPMGFWTYRIAYGNGTFLAVDQGGSYFTSGKPESNPLPRLNTYYGGMSIFGKVGIGKTNPSYTLDVVGGIRTSGTSSSINIYPNSGGQSMVNFYNNSGVNVDSYNSYMDGNFYFNHIANSGRIDFRTTDAYVSRLAIDSASGNVGIGTTTPTTKLSISGGTGNVLYLNGGQISGLNSTPVNADQAVPLGYLQANYLSSAAASSSGWLLSGNSVTNDNAWLGSISNYDVSFRTNNTERMRILKGGNIGIGTTNPGTNKLQVNGNIYANNSSNAILVNSAAGSRAIYSDNSNFYSPSSHDSNSWLRNSLNTWTFQGGTAGDSWTETAQLYLNPVGTAGADDKLIELGQRRSNSTAGDYKGLRIVHYTGSAVADGYLQAGNAYFSGNMGIGSTTPALKLVVNGGTGNSVNVAGGFVNGLNSTPVNSDQAVPLGYLQANYSPSTATNLWVGTKNGNIWNGDSGGGNVGIGTTAPSTKLDVSGYAFFGTTNKLKIQDLGGEYISVQGTLATDDNTKKSIVLNAWGGNVGIGITNPMLKLHLNGDMAFGTSNNATINQGMTGNQNYFTFSTDGIEKMRIANGGNIGIGTTNPSEKLESRGGTGNSLIYGALLSNADTTNTGGSMTGIGFAVNNTTVPKAGVLFERIASYGLGNLYFSLNNVGDNTTKASKADAKMTILNSGNVGIGTTTPTTKLSVSGGTGNALYMNGGQISGLNSTPVNSDQAVPLGYLQANYSPTTATNNAWTMTGNTLANDNAWLGSISNYDVSFKTNNTERMRILKGGNVGIGTTNPTQKLDVMGNAIFESGGAIYLRNSSNNASTKLGDSGSTGVNLFTINTGGVDRLVVDNSGNVGIGITNPGTYKLNVNGTSYFNDTLTLRTWYNKPQKNYLRADDNESFINIDDNMNINEIAEALGRTSVAGMTKVDDPTAPAPGAFEVSGYQTVGPDSNTPYWKVDRSSEYIFETWIKVVSSTATPQRFYAGWEMYDAAKTSFGNNQRYWGSGGTEYDVDSYNDGAWHHIVARISGVGSGYGQFINGTEYARLVLLFNYSSGDTITRFAGMKLYKSKKIFTSIYAKNGSQATVDSDGKLIIDYNGNVFANNLQVAGTGPHYFSAGNVGIGTTTPAIKLSISGGTGDVINVGGGQIAGLNSTPVNNDHAVSLLYLKNNYVPLGSGAGGVGTGTSGQTLRHNGTSWVANSTIYNNGTNVGIGTNSPRTALEILSNVGSASPSASSANITATDNSPMAAGVGGAFSFSGKYTSTGTLISGAAYIRSYKMNAVDGDYGFGLQFGTRANGSGTTAPAMTIDSTGNVGIGMTNPLGKLEINAGTNGYMQINNSGTASGNGIRLVRNSASDWSGVNFYASSTLTWAFGENSAGFGLFEGGTAANTRLIVKAGGNVGIGTTNPGAKLQIGSATYGPNGNLGNNMLQIKSPSGFAYITIGNGDTVNSTSYIGGASGYTVFGKVTDAGALTEFMRIDGAAGNVGIGTTTPSLKLVVNGGTGDSLSLAGGFVSNLNSTPINRDQAVPLGYLQDNYAPLTGAGSAFVQGGNNFGALATLGTKDNNLLNFNTNNLTRMTIAANGNVGIANTNPQASFHLGGGMILNNTTVADTDYTILGSDYIVAYTSISTNRIVNVPNSLCTPGRFFVVVDQSGSSSASKQIIIDPEGSTPIVGQNTFSLTSPYNSVYIFCGNSAWYVL